MYTLKLNESKLYLSLRYGVIGKVKWRTRAKKLRDPRVTYSIVGIEIEGKSGARITVQKYTLQTKV